MTRTTLRRVYPQEQLVEVQVDKKMPRRVVGRGIQESTLYDVEVTVGTVRLSLLEKVFDTPNSSAETILERHRLLKERGLPVIPLVFVGAEVPHSLFVTDLTRGGRSKCFSVMDWESDGNRHGTECGKYCFYNLRNPETVASNFADLIHLATQRGVLMWHGDIFFLIIDENGNGKIILGDLGRVTFPDNAKGFFGQELVANTNIARSFIHSMNRHLVGSPLPVDRFSSRLDELRRTGL